MSKRAVYTDDSAVTVEGTDPGAGYEYDFSTAGTKTVAVSYREKTTQFSVTVASEETSGEDIKEANDFSGSRAVQDGLAVAEALAEDGAVAALDSVTAAREKADAIEAALEA